MKAIVYARYGPPELLEFKDVERPVPASGQVLVRVRAASLNALDYRRFENSTAIGRFVDERLLRSTGKILGADIAGEVEAVTFNPELQFVAGLMRFFEKVGEGGDPGEANRIFGAPRTTLGNWCHAQAEYGAEQ